MLGKVQRLKQLKRVCAWLAAQPHEELFENLYSSRTEARDQFRLFGRALKVALTGAVRAAEHAASDRLKARIRSLKLWHTGKSGVGTTVGEVPGMKNEGRHFCGGTDRSAEAKDSLLLSLSSTTSVVLHNFLTLGS